MSEFWYFAAGFGVWALFVYYVVEIPICRMLSRMRKVEYAPSLYGWAVEKEMGDDTEAYWPWQATFWTELGKEAGRGAAFLGALLVGWAVRLALWTAYVLAVFSLSS